MFTSVMSNKATGMSSNDAHLAGMLNVFLSSTINSSHQAQSIATPAHAMWKNCVNHVPT